MERGRKKILGGFFSSVGYFISWESLIYIKIGENESIYGRRARPRACICAHTFLNKNLLSKPGLTLIILSKERLTLIIKEVKFKYLFGRELEQICMGKLGAMHLGN